MRYFQIWDKLRYLYREIFTEREIFLEILIHREILNLKLEIFSAVYNLMSFNVFLMFSICLMKFQCARCESAMEIENEVSQAARTINNGVYGTRETKLCSPHTHTGRISAWVYEGNWISVYDYSSHEPQRIVSTRAFLAIPVLREVVLEFRFCIQTSARVCQSRLVS